MEREESLKNGTEQKHINPDKFVRINYEDLERGDNNAYNQLCHDFHHHNFAIITLSPTYVSKLEPSTQLISDFFSQTQEEKNKWLMNEDHDFGYVLIPGQKEHFQMRKEGERDYPYKKNIHNHNKNENKQKDRSKKNTDGSERLKSNSTVVTQSIQTNGKTELLNSNKNSKNTEQEKKHKWPSKAFQEVSFEFYDFMMTISKTCLKGLAISLGLPPSTFLDLLDDGSPSDTKPTSSSTIFRYFRYFLSDEGQLKGTVGTHSHTDIGIMSIVPSSAVPGLEIYHNATTEWIPVESLTTTHDLIVFPAETLQRITNFYFNAAVHKVVRNRNQERFSKVWLLRGRSDALLDTAALTLASPHLGTVVKEYKEPVSISTFMKMNYPDNVSSNFVPGTEKNLGRPYVNFHLK